MPPTLPQLDRIARDARQFIEAHERRKPEHPTATLAEREALALLYAELRAALFPSAQAA